MAQVDISFKILEREWKSDGYLKWWLSLGLICCEQSQLLGRVASSASHKNIANVWWLSDFGEKGWTSIAKPEFLFEGCFCNTCFSLDVSREEQVLLAFFELLFVAFPSTGKSNSPPRRSSGMEFNPWFSQTGDGNAILYQVIGSVVSNHFKGFIDPRWYSDT